MRSFFYKFAILIFIAAGSLSLGSFVRAQTATDIQDKISSANIQLEKLKQEIPILQQNLNSIGTQKKTLNTSIVELDLTKKKLDTEIKVTQINVDTTVQKISELSSQISDRQKQIESNIAAIKEAMRGIYEQDAHDLMDIALSNDSFSGVWDDVEAINQFNINTAKSIDQLKAFKTDLEMKTAQKTIEKQNYLSLKNELGDKKKIAEDTKAQKTELLVQTKNRESAYAKLLQQKMALAESLEQEIRNYEQTLKFILDPTSIPPRKTPVFSLPIDGLRLPQDITQQFGKTVDSVRLYASGTHNGTDFRASIGTPVKAMLNGTVMGTGNTDIACPRASYGKWVLIRHNNGLATLYAHFSLIKVSAGDVVTTGQVIGYSGNTGYTTGPHLHVTVFAAAAVEIKSLPSKACSGRTYTMPLAAINAYLDPMDYL